MTLLEIIGLFYCVKLMCRFLDVLCEVIEHRAKYGVLTGPQNRARREVIVNE